MGSTYKTTNIELSQFLGTDKPAWVNDYNADMLKIDSAVGENVTDISTAQSRADSAYTLADNTASSVSSLSTQVSDNTTDIATAQGNITTINSLIGNGTPTTTDQTIIGAINEINAEVNDIGTVYEYTLTSSHTFSASGTFDDLGSVTVPAGTYLICITGEGNGSATTDTLTKYRANVNTRDLATVRNLNGYGQTASVSYVYTTDSSSTITLQGSTSSTGSNPSTPYARLSAVRLK